MLSDNGEYKHFILKMADIIKNDINKFMDFIQDQSHERPWYQKASEEAAINALTTTLACYLQYAYKEGHKNYYKDVITFFLDDQDWCDELQPELESNLKSILDDLEDI